MNTVPPLENPGEGLRLLQDWMQLLDHEDWMLVLDNYDDVQVDIRSFIPVGAVGRILVTSRDRRIIGSVASSGFAPSEMRVEDAKRLFLSIRGRCAQDGKVDDDSSDPEDEVLQQILHELQYFPLAIDQAASFIRENAPMTLVEYLDFLRPRGVDRERLMRFKEANPAYPESVMTTWEISLHHLQQSRPRTAWILQVLGFLDHSYIAEELLVATNETRPWVFNSTFQGRQLPPNLLDDLKYLNNDVGFRLAIGTLTSLSLIKRNASQRTLYVHPLVHEWIRVRLNSDPTKQAEFTIAAILILYQSFPLELVTWLPDQFPSMSVELHQRVDETTHHLRAVLANIRDYHHHIVTLPLECFTLMEVYYLTGLPQHAIYALDLPKALLVKLQAVIRLLVPHLPPGQKELAHFVHKATIWIQSGPSVKTDLKVPNKIVKSLESLALPLWLSDDDATFIMLFSTTVIDASKKTVGNRMPGNDVFTEASIVEKSPLRKCSLLLLMGLHTLLTAISRESRLMSWVMFMVQLRLFRNMSPEEFAKLDVFHIDYLVSAEVLGYLEPNQRATHLCRLMQLYWASPWPRDYLAIVKLFDTGLAESKARLAEEQREVEMQRDEEFIKLSSYKDYISSSSGRVYESTGGINRTNKHTDLITPFNYFWTITLDLAESLSSPDLCWKLDSQSSNKSTKLDLAQRKWALKNVPSTKKLYERIREEQGEDSRTEASFLKRFEDVEVAFTLVIVYKNLEDWPRLQTAVWKSLQCDNILAWCKKSGHTPWEPRKRKSDTSQIEREKGDLRRPQMTQSPISQSQTSQVRLSKMSSAISLGVDTKNPEHAWKEWHTWLQAAAYERSQTVSSHMYTGDIEDRLRELPEMRKFGLPDSCNCILRNRVDDIIAAFIVLCEHKEAISQSDAIGETARLGSLSSILPLGARYLGRLEIIYYLSEAFLAKVPRSELNTYRLEASDETQDLSAESSEEEDTEGAEDIFQMDENAGGEDLDWTW